MKKRQRQKSIDADQLDRFMNTYTYHWFAFYQGWQENRTLKPHHLRDGPAFSQLCVALDDRGGRYEKMFRNGPASPAVLRHYAEAFKALLNPPLVEDFVEYRPVDESFLEKGDLLVVTTRLPMNDFQQGDKVQVQPGFTSLEQKLIRLCRPYVPICSRSRVRIAAPLADQLGAEYADRADIQFNAYEEAWYTLLRTANPGARERRQKRVPYRSAAYLLQLPSVPELNGADLLVVWGQGGTQTLALTQLLRGDLSYLLDLYGFSMIEMYVPESAVAPEKEEPFRFLEFLLSGEVHVLLKGVLLDPGGQRVARPKAVRRRKRSPRRKRASPMKRVRRSPPDARQARSDG